MAVKKQESIVLKTEGIHFVFPFSNKIIGFYNTEPTLNTTHALLKSSDGFQFETKSEMEYVLSDPLAVAAKIKSVSEFINYKVLFHANKYISEKKATSILLSLDKIDSDMLSTISEDLFNYGITVKSFKINLQDNVKFDEASMVYVKNYANLESEQIMPDMGTADEFNRTMQMYKKELTTPLKINTYQSLVYSHFLKKLQNK